MDRRETSRENGANSGDGHDSRPRAKAGSGKTPKRKTTARSKAKPGSGEGDVSLANLLRPRRMTMQQKLAALEAVRGDWKDRPEWKGMTSIQIAEELRSRSMRRRPNG